MVIDTAALLLLSLALLTVPLNWLLAALAAAAVHELCHLAAVKALGGRAEGFRIGCCGAELTVTGLRPAGEILCALAGPVGGLSLLLLCRQFPRLAICAAIQSGFNLLPIWPLDGGRVLQLILLRILSPERGLAVLAWTEGIVCAVIFVAALLLRMGPVPVLGALWLICRALSRKIPCKVPRPGVQ